jgi:hypothetical protein
LILICIKYGVSELISGFVLWLWTTESGCLLPLFYLLLFSVFLFFLIRREVKFAHIHLKLLLIKSTYFLDDALMPHVNMFIWKFIKELYTGTFWMCNSPWKSWNTCFSSWLSNFIYMSLCINNICFTLPLRFAGITIKHIPKQLLMRIRKLLRKANIYLGSDSI